eukprot:s1704_g5.t1
MVAFQFAMLVHQRVKSTALVNSEPWPKSSPVAARVDSDSMERVNHFSRTLAQREAMRRNSQKWAVEDWK